MGSLLIRTIKSVAFLLILAGCATSYTEITWQDEATEDTTIQNLLVVYTFPHTEESRALVEKEVCFALNDKGYNATPVTRYLEQPTRESVIQTMDENGFDGALVIRLKDITYESRYDPSVHVNSTGKPEENAFFQSFDQRGYNNVTTDQVIIAETRIFQRVDTKLLGVLESKTFSLHTFDEIVSDFSLALANTLHSSKLLKSNK